MESKIGLAGDMGSQKRAALQHARIIRPDQGSYIGLAGNMSGAVRGAVDREARQERRRTSATHRSLGDQATGVIGQHAVIFSAFHYDVTPYVETARGGFICPDPQALRWRPGREAFCSRATRQLPYMIDSSGYGRWRGEAPQWAHSLEVYFAARELTDPDGWAAFDDPESRTRTLDWLRATVASYPRDADPASGNFWPIYSMLWSWNANARLDEQRLAPCFRRGVPLHAYIPFTSTQVRPTPTTLERLAYQAIANAQRAVQDPDLRWMAMRTGRVMIGGMAQSPCHRLVRGLYGAQLYYQLARDVPDIKVWLLGQASAYVVNSLGVLGLLDKIWLDGSWFIQNACTNTIPIVQDGLITMLSLGKGRFGESAREIQTFFTTEEKMGAHARSLLSARAGLIQWPPEPDVRPIDLRDLKQRVAVKQHYQQAQMELGLA